MHQADLIIIIAKGYAQLMHSWHRLAFAKWLKGVKLSAVCTSACLSSICPACMHRIYRFAHALAWLSDLTDTEPAAHHD